MHNNSSHSFWSRRYDINGQKLLRSNEFIIRFAWVIMKYAEGNTAIFGRKKYSSTSFQRKGLNLHRRHDDKLKHDWCSTPPWFTRNDNTANYSRLNEQNSKRVTSHATFFDKKILCNDRALSTYLEGGCERAGSARRYLSSLVRLVKHHSSTYIYRFIRYPYLSRTLRGSYIATGPPQWPPQCSSTIFARSISLKTCSLNLSSFTVFSFIVSLSFSTFDDTWPIVFARSLNIFSPCLSFSFFFSRSIVSRSHPISMRYFVSRARMRLDMSVPLCPRLYGDNKETSQKLFRCHQRQIVCIFS